MIIIKSAVIEEVVIESNSVDIELHDCKIKTVIIKESDDENINNT